MIDAIIFDLDGTLADTMDDLKTAMNSMLTRLGYKNRTKAELLTFINNGSREFVRRSLPESVQDVDFIIESALETYSDEYQKCYCVKTHEFEGIGNMLTELSAMGVKLAVLSNKQDEFVKKIISELFPKIKFGYVMGQVEGIPKKPDPTAPLLICDEMGVKQSRCMFVGDSDVDINTAKNAGMTSVGVSWGYRSVKALKEAGATYIAGSPLDIVNILRFYKKKRKVKAEEKKVEVEITANQPTTTKTSTLKPTETTSEVDAVPATTGTTDIPLDSSGASTTPTGEQVHISVESGVAAPTSEDAVAPTSEDAAAPTSEDAVAPTGEDTVAPTSEGAVAPTSEDAVAPTGDSSAE